MPTCTRRGQPRGGVAQDVANWMQKALSPYARHMSPEASLAATRLNVLEALKFGTTTFGDYAWPLPGWGQIFCRLWRAGAAHTNH